VVLVRDRQVSQRDAQRRDKAIAISIQLSGTRLSRNRPDLSGSFGKRPGIQFPAVGGIRWRASEPAAANQSRGRIAVRKMLF
jgi:hypothetical protein